MERNKSYFWRKQEFELKLNPLEYCFICLKTSETAENSNLEDISIRNLCHYLKIKLKDVLADEKMEPKHGGMKTKGYLKSLERTDLKVSLCESCRRHFKMFSDLFQKLESIQMQINHCLKNIHESFGENLKKSDNFKDPQSDIETTSSSSSSVIKKLSKTLRKQLLIKTNSAFSRRGSRCKVTIARIDFNKQTSQKQDSCHDLETMDSSSSNLPSSSSKSLQDDSKLNETIKKVEGVTLGLETKEELPDDQFPINFCQLFYIEETPSNPYIFPQNTVNPLSLNRPASSEQQVASQTVPSKNKQFKYKDPRNYNFLCRTCGRKFGRKSHLTRHFKNVHLKIKNQFCDICKKEFRDGTALKDHQIRIHSEQVLCTNCNKVFTDRSTYNSHIKNCLKTTGHHQNSSKNVEMVLPTPQTIRTEPTITSATLQKPVEPMGCSYSNNQYQNFTESNFNSFGCEAIPNYNHFTAPFGYTESQRMPMDNSSSRLMPWNTVSHPPSTMQQMSVNSTAMSGGNCIYGNNFYMPYLQQNRHRY